MKEFAPPCGLSCVTGNLLCVQRRTSPSSPKTCSEWNESAPRAVQTLRTEKWKTEKYELIFLSSIFLSAGSEPEIRIYLELSSDSRYWVGETPIWRLNILEKWLWSEKPAERAIWLSGALEATISRQANSSRRRRRWSPTVL